MQDSTFRKEIEVLYKHFFGRIISGCKNCYVDALIELCVIKKETAMAKTTLFVVRRGKILKDIVKNDARLNLVRGNETEELALYHLHTNPNSAKFFEVLPPPDQLKEMLSKYTKKLDPGKAPQKAIKKETESESSATGEPVKVEELIQEIDPEPKEPNAPEKKKPGRPAKNITEEDSILA
jgi:hypothetical protein